MVLDPADQGGQVVFDNKPIRKAQEIDNAREVIDRLRKKKKRVLNEIIRAQKNL